MREAVEAMRSGAEYYFQKPVDLEELLLILQKALGYARLRQEAQRWQGHPHPIVGKSRQVQGLWRLVSLMAQNPSTTVLIEGETGTGKELLARNIHAQSARAQGPFVALNCAAVPEGLFESELFGHERGAFTDAKSTKRGLLELAHGGTLFLDEVAEMPLSAQAKLLRVVETLSFRRLGGLRDIRVDVRLVAATNRDLQEAVRTGTFREDLYWRLNVMPIKVPPLRERPEDIPLLSEFFLQELSKSTGIRKELSPDALAALMRYRWPGNVRELRNVLERALLLSQGPRVTARDLLLPSGKTSEQEAPLSLREVQCQHIRRVLAYTRGNRTQAARLLGIARSTLNEKLKDCGQRYRG